MDEVLRWKVDDDLRPLSCYWLVSTPPPLMGLLDFFSRHSFERLFTLKKKMFSSPCWQESWCTCAGPSSLASPPLAHLIQSAVPKNHQNSFVVKNVFSGDSYLDENPVDVLYNLITTFSSQLILKNLSACFQHKVVSNMVSFEEEKTNIG